MNKNNVFQLAIKKYKNLSDQSVELSNLTVILGPNGSGKSNFVSTLKFLQLCFADSDIESGRGQTSFADAALELGGSKILNGSVKKPSNVDLEYRFRVDNETIILKISILIQDSIRPVIINEEWLGRDRGHGEPFYFYRAHNKFSGSGVVSVFDQEASNTSHFEQMPNMPIDELALGAISRLLETSEFSPEQTPVYEVRRALLGTISQWRFYNANNMDLGEIRRSEPKLGSNDIFLSSTGKNLALVLHNLVQSDFEFEETIQQLFKDILPGTRRLRAVTSGRLSLTIEWYTEGSDEAFYLDEMSDGTVRMLCWAIILNSPKLPSLLVLDEPELGIHVAWMPKLAAWIKSAASRTQVIVSTHSPDLLDHLTDQLDGPGRIYAFSPGNENTHLFNIRQVTTGDVQEWLDDDYELGDLYRTGNTFVGGWPW